VGQTNIFLVCIGAMQNTYNCGMLNDIE